MRKLAFLLSTASLMAPVACTSLERGDNALSGTSELVRPFNDAAARFDVPADVLGAWSFLETRVTHPDSGDGHGPPSAGIMGLPPVLVSQGAHLLRVTPQQVEREDVFNIRAVAALLRSAADEHGRPTGRLDRDGAAVDWLEVMALARGIQAPELRRAYQEMGAEVLSRGVNATDEHHLTLRSVGRGEIHLLAPLRVEQGVDPEDPYSARFLASPNFGSRQGAAIDTVILHTMQGSYAGSISWFQNASAGVSSHYCVRSSDGEITQMVHLADSAWHAGNSGYNRRSVGIEHEGYVADPGRWYTEAMYRQSARLVRWLADTYGFPMDRQHVIGHYQVPVSGNGAPCSTTATNCGGASGHTDPGAAGTAWDWAHYMDLIVSNGASSSSSGGGSSSSGSMTDRQIVGVIYDASQSTSARISGATVRLLSAGNQVATLVTPANGYFSFPVTAGDYQVNAAAAGFQTGTRDAQASAPGDNWASLGLTPSGSVQTGTLLGVIYLGPGLGENPVEGATVSVPGQSPVTTGGDGRYSFDLAAGEYTVTASLSGYLNASATRTVGVGTDVWASLMLTPNSGGPPPVPTPISPVAGAVVAANQVVFQFERVADPAGGILTYEVQVFAGQQATGSPLFTLTEPQTAGSPVQARPSQVLSAGDYAWQVRAHGAAGSSPFSDVAWFTTSGPPDGSSSSGGSSGGGSSSGGSSSGGWPVPPGCGGNHAAQPSTATWGLLLLFLLRKAWR